MKKELKSVKAPVSEVIEVEAEMSHEAVDAVDALRIENYNLLHQNLELQKQIVALQAEMNMVAFKSKYSLKDGDSVDLKSLQLTRTRS